MADIMHLTVGQLLSKIANQYPDHEAVVYADRDLRYTYRQFYEICGQVAKGFMKLGLAKGDHLSIWASNYPEWLITQFATGRMGAVLVTVNTNYRTAELEYLLRQSDTTTLILMESYRGVSYTEMLYEIVPELKDAEPGKLQSQRLPYLKNVIILSDKKYPGMFNWSDVLELGKNVSDEELREREESLDPFDVINMQYTSGTTGFPKGVMLTHSNIINNGRNIAECMNLTHKDRLCIPVPFFHCFGCVLGTMACVSVGATMVPVQEFNALEVLKTVEKERCTGLHGVPTMFIAELNHPEFSSFDLSSLRTGIMAGSPCPIEVMKAVVERMGAREITIAYGQTESSPVITQTRTNDPIDLRVTTVGRPLPHVEVKIVDPSTGRELPPGEQGELCTRGYHVMKGYYKNPEATEKAIDKDGWLHTGDLATMDENGYFKITGRLKDMIIRGGENIYPREIEEFLYTHPKIRDVQVIGVPSVKYGEEVMAWIQVKEGETLTPEEVRAYCEGKIARFKIPRYIEFCETFPMTASGKIQKFKLREQAIELLGLHDAASIETA
jgi:fatty-acyl-CoA synthase